MIDIVKLQKYNQWLYDNHLYDEDEAQYHQELTRHVTERFFDPLCLPKDARILDMGCGPGFFLDQLISRGYTNYEGITLSQQDKTKNESRHHKIGMHDISFLPEDEGYTDGSVDFIFLRHVLEHSPYPVITLMEYNRLLKMDGIMYIEMPIPNDVRKHETNMNHYSIMGEEMLHALLYRLGFQVVEGYLMKSNLELHEGDRALPFVETTIVAIVKKIKSLDVK